MADERSRFKEVWHRIDILYSQYARKMGINFTALLLLDCLTESDEPLTQKALCEKLILPKQLVNALINNLREQGCVELREARDRRNKTIHLTPQGKAYARSILQPFDDAEEQVWQNFTDEELNVFANGLEKYERVLGEKLGFHVPER